MSELTVADLYERYAPALRRHILYRLEMDDEGVVA